MLHKISRGRWALLLGLSVGLQACPDPTPPVPTPCSAAERDPLTFTVAEAFGAPMLDTLYNDGPVGFAAPKAPYTKYEWLVGPATTRTTRTFGLSFDRTIVGPLPVRLIARRPPNPRCPGDDGVDTLTRVLTFVPRDLQQWKPAIFGKFQGANTDTPRDTFTIHIYLGKNFYFPNNPLAPPMPYLAGLPKGCDLPYFDIGVDWRGVDAASGGCTDFDARVVLTTRDSVRMTHRTQVSPTPIDKVFLGKRIR